MDLYTYEKKKTQKDREREGWDQNMKEWTCMDLKDILRKAEKREERSRIAVKASLAS